MLNISNNNIGTIAVLNTCHALQSLDASENSIQQIEDLSQLTSLKVIKSKYSNDNISFDFISI